MIINKVLHHRKAKYPVQVKTCYAPVKTHSKYKILKKNKKDPVKIHMLWLYEVVYTFQNISGVFC